MATNDELQEQLKLTQSINRIVERMAVSVSSIESSYENQATQLEKLNSIINQVSTDSAVQAVTKLSESIKKVVDELGNIGSNAEQNMQKMMLEAGKASTEVSTLNDRLANNVNNLKKIGDASNQFDKVATSVGNSAIALNHVTGNASEAGDMMAGLNNNIKESSNSLREVGTSSDEVDKIIEELKNGEMSSKGMNQGLGGIVDTLKKKFPKGAAVATAAITGFWQGLKNVVAIGKSVIGFMGSMASSATSVAISIAAIPLKIFTGLVDLAASASMGMAELMQAVEDVRKAFGDLQGPTSAAIKEVHNELSGFSDTGLSSWRVFGTLAERLNFIREVAEGMGATFGILKQEFKDNGGALLAYQKGLGITSDQMKSFAQRAITVGQPLSDLMLDTTKQTLELGKAFGISQKIIGKDMAKAFEDMRHFATLSVKEIGQASVYARKLGVELDKIVGTLDAFETFDSAAENAAKLTQSFGVTVDAFKLMEAQSPAEQIDMLKKSFAAAGVDASNFNRQQLKLLTSTTGLDEATARQVFSMENQGASLDDIKKKSETAEKKQLTQAQAMSKLADSIERMIKTGSQTGSFFDMFVKGIGRGLQSTKDFRGMIWNIKRGLQQVFYVGVQLGRQLPQIIPGLDKILGGLRRFFDPKLFKGLAQNVSKSIVDFFKGNKSLPEALNSIRESFMNMFDSEGPIARDIYDGFKQMFRKAADIVVQAIPLIAGKLKDALILLTQFISDPKALLSGAKGPATKEFGFFTEAFLDVAESLKDGFDVIWPHLKDLLKVVFDKVVAFIQKPEVMGLLSKAVPAIATALFGPAMIKSMFTALSVSLFSGGTAAKAVQGITKKIGASTLLKGAGKFAGPAAIAAAAVSVGEGVNKYTDKITTTMDRNERVIAAGATGLVDALTLGLLPDDFSTMIANALGSASKIIFDLMGKFFGAGFADSLKRRLSSTFELIGGVVDFFKAMFGGSQDEFETASVELGKKLLRFVINALEFTFVQVPIFVGKMAAKLLNVLGQSMLKILTMQFGMIAKFLHQVTGGKLDIRGKVKEVGVALQGGMDDMTKDLVHATDEASQFVANESKRFQDTVLKLNSQQAETVKKSAAATGQAQVDGTKAAKKHVEKSISEIAGDISSVKNLSKTLEDDNFDIAGTVKRIREKISTVDFKVLSEDQASTLGQTSESLAKIRELIGNLAATNAKIAEIQKSNGAGFDEHQIKDVAAIAVATSNIAQDVNAKLASEETLKNVAGRLHDVAQIFSILSSFPKNVQKAVSSIKQDGLRPAAEAVSTMVTLVNEMEDALSDANLNKVNIKTKLGNVAKAVGLGSKARYTIKNKAVNIAINLQVTMNAEDMEKALIMRSKSVIRDRINFATNSPADRGTDTIPDTQEGPLKFPITPGAQ